MVPHLVHPGHEWKRVRLWSQVPCGDLPPLQHLASSVPRRRQGRPWARALLCAEEHEGSEVSVATCSQWGHVLSAQTVGCGFVCGSTNEAHALRESRTCGLCYLATSYLEEVF